jgi:dienelactone hydrolase
MKSFKLFLCFVQIFLFSHSSYSQCETGRYRDFIFENVQLASDIEYGTNASYNGTETTLLLDVYTPVGDQENLRPLIIMCHGGFFVTGDKAATDVAPACNDFARMGYVAASINYRLGFPLGLNLAGPMSQAVLRAVQDLKASVRYFRKSVAENGNPFGIDTTQIYVGGLSAGGFTCLHAAYMQDDELPTNIDPTQPGLAGGVEGESGNEGYSSDFNALISISGAIVDTTFIEANDKPACLFHGPDDTVVPYDSDMLVIAGFFQVQEVDGSNSIAQKLTQLGIDHCFEIYEGQGHVPSVTQAAYYDTTLSVMTNFLSHYVCGAALDCSYREILTSTQELNAPNPLKVWPNPAGNTLFVQPNDATVDALEIYNTTGLIVLTMQKVAGSQTAEIDITRLSSGYYVVQRRNGPYGLSRMGFVKE